MPPHKVQADAMTVLREVDARGLLCPLPVLKARKILLGLSPGDELCILADDPMAVIDMPHFCEEAGHAYLGMTDAAGWQVYRVRCGPPKAEA
jgi:tRNA 2-thiouridine synthesizing protein A